MSGLHNLREDEQEHNATPFISCSVTYAPPRPAIGGNGLDLTGGYSK